MDYDKQLLTKKATERWGSHLTNPFEMLCLEMAKVR
jgi:hypothetical protein